MRHTKTFLALAALVLFASGPAPADNRDLADTAEAIRKGEIDVGDRYDMDKNKGRFHRIHSETIGLECESCHVAKHYAPDYLLLNKDNAELKAAGKGKGEKSDVLDRSVCLGCHKTNGVATTWFQVADQ